MDGTADRLGMQLVADNILEQILRKLDSLERRLARLEAGSGQAASAAPPAPPAPAQPPAAPVPTPKPSATRFQPFTPPPPPGLGTPDEPFTTSTSLPLPDLSQIDEKLKAPKKIPVKIDTVAGIESLPRICRQIQMLWGKREAEEFINTLIIDSRGNRQGFPMDVMEELLFLGRLSRIISGYRPSDIWEDHARIGDRR